MKTHNEVHDMIQTASSAPTANNIGHVLDICTALNEQIGAFDNYVGALVKNIGVLNDRVAKLEERIESLDGLVQLLSSNNVELNKEVGELFRKLTKPL